MFANAKTGFKMLFISAILTIVGDCSVIFNGASVFGTILAAVGLVAFVLNLVGLKRCAKDEAEYNKPFYFTIAALILCLILTIVSAVKNDLTWATGANELQGVMNYLVAYLILKTTAGILRQCGKEAEAVSADKLRNLYTVAFSITVALNILGDVFASGVAATVLGLLLVLAAAVVLIVVQIKYIVFLKKTADVL